LLVSRGCVVGELVVHLSSAFVLFLLIFVVAVFFWRKIYFSLFTEWSANTVIETVTLLAACKIRNPFTQFEHVLIDFVNRLYHTDSTSTHSYSMLPTQ